jgi:hypothetical protein
MWANGWSFRAALEAVACDLRLDLGGSWTALKPRPKPSPTDASSGDPTNAEQAIRRVWEQTIEPDGQEAEPMRRYLLRRGIETLPNPSVVRFHPALGYYEDRVKKGAYPAMIARVTSPQAALVSLHRTYLTREGRKAPVACRKKTMTACGPMQGGAIRLFPAGPELGIAEGIETALAVRERTGMPVWAALSATLLERWEPPADVRLVVIWADLDRSGAGQAAANGLRDRLLAHGLQVALQIPPGPIPKGQKGLDWADLWRLRLRSAA